MDPIEIAEILQELVEINQPEQAFEHEEEVNQEDASKKIQILMMMKNPIQHVMTLQRMMAQ
jgi:hypothetical protein